MRLNYKSKKSHSLDIHIMSIITKVFCQYSNMHLRLEINNANWSQPKILKIIDLEHSHISII